MQLLYFSVLLFFFPISFSTVSSLLLESEIQERIIGLRYQICNTDNKQRNIYHTVNDCVFHFLFLTYARI